MLASVLLQAGLPEPDNVIYGTLTFGGQPVTAARTDVVVEARRTPTGPPLGAYRMGDDRRLGDFYRLKVRLESAPPLTAPEASLAGDRLYVVVRSEGSALAQAAIEVGQRGRITRLDFADSDPDQDGNGLADDWELLHLGRTGNDPNADPDQDGQSTLEEFLAGTAPNDPASVCRIEVQPGPIQTIVTFVAREASGVGYQNHTRYHTLESAGDPGGPWAAVPGVTEVAGQDQLLSHPIVLSNTQAFYRVRIWLEVLP